MQAARMAARSFRPMMRAQFLRKQVKYADFICMVLYFYGARFMSVAMTHLMLISGRTSAQELQQCSFR